MKQAFIFDINRCVGCHACMVACTNENGTEPPLYWRQVVSSNPKNHPLLPVFYHSLACNHCELAPCMSNCPAEAFSRDLQTGAVIHHPDKCIGCKYCTWACPYDAPAYNGKSGVVEKCSFCNHRLQEGLQPACTQMCPTGALSFGAMEVGSEVAEVHGFTEAGIRPAIQFIPLRKHTSRPRTSEPLPENVPDDALQEPPPKIHARKEWPLIVFTLLTALLTASFTAAKFSGFTLLPKVFFGTGILAALLSALHLGRKERLFRALLNLRSSWLSREILGYSIFLGGAVIYFLLLPGNAIIFWITVLAGFFTSFAIDRVYDVVDKKFAGKLHSAQVVFTALLFTAFFMGNYYNVALLAAIKLVLFIYRKWNVWIKQGFTQPEHLAKGGPPGFGPLFIDSLRADFLVTIPLILWWINPAGLDWYIFISLMAGEIMDRIMFYNELDVITPQKQILKIKS